MNTFPPVPAKAIYTALVPARPGNTWEEALGSHFVFNGIIKCIAAYGENLETRWRRALFRTLNASSLVYPGL